MTHTKQLAQSHAVQAIKAYNKVEELHGKFAAANKEIEDIFSSQFTRFSFEIFKRIRFLLDLSPSELNISSKAATGCNFATVEGGLRMYRNNAKAWEILEHGDKIVLNLVDLVRGVTVYSFNENDYDNLTLDAYFLLHTALCVSDTRYMYSMDISKGVFMSREDKLDFISFWLDRKYFPELICLAYSDLIVDFFTEIFTSMASIMPRETNILFYSIDRNDFGKSNIKVNCDQRVVFEQFDIRLNDNQFYFVNFANPNAVIIKPKQISILPIKEVLMVIKALFSIHEKWEIFMKKSRK